jgi:hypothetical protein
VIIYATLIVNKCNRLTAKANVRQNLIIFYFLMLGQLKAPLNVKMIKESMKSHIFMLLASKYKLEKCLAEQKLYENPYQMGPN